MKDRGSGREAMGYRGSALRQCPLRPYPCLVSTYTAVFKRLRATPEPRSIRAPLPSYAHNSMVTRKELTIFFYSTSSIWPPILATESLIFTVWFQDHHETHTPRNRSKYAPSTQQECGDGGMPLYFRIGVSDGRVLFPTPDLSADLT